MGLKQSKKQEEGNDVEGKQPRPQKQQHLSKERSCAEALMMACDERLGAQSPAALMVCDTFLARDFWTRFVHPSFAPYPPAASKMWACGDNSFGQLGLGDDKNRKTPTEVTALHGRRIHAVACGIRHTMAVVDDGELWAAGCNNHGQLGVEDTIDRVLHYRVESIADRRVAAVACGYDHTLILLETGDVFACGYNRQGQLGIGGVYKMTPEPVATLAGKCVVAISCGASHSAAVLVTGELFSWGQGAHIGSSNTPTQVFGLSGRCTAVSCGGFHTAAITGSSGDLFTWGSNGEGQLGIGNRIRKEKPQLVEALRGRSVGAIACGRFHMMALLENGDVFAWGNNSKGQLGSGSRGELVNTPQQVHFFWETRLIHLLWRILIRSSSGAFRRTVCLGFQQHQDWRFAQESANRKESLLRRVWGFFHRCHWELKERALGPLLFAHVQVGF